jgi:hypothetical protein
MSWDFSDFVQPVRKQYAYAMNSQFQIITKSLPDGIRPNSLIRLKPFLSKGEWSFNTAPRSNLQPSLTLCIEKMISRSKIHPINPDDS